jgi:hypothetical protein
VKRGQDVYVILNPTYLDHSTLFVPNDSANIGVQFSLELCGDPGRSVLRAQHDMALQARITVAHLDTSLSVLV